MTLSWAVILGFSVFCFYRLSLEGKPPGDSHRESG